MWDYNDKWYPIIMPYIAQLLEIIPQMRLTKTLKQTSQIFHYVACDKWKDYDSRIKYFIKQNNSWYTVLF